MLEFVLHLGVNAVNFYAQTVLKDAGFSQDKAFELTVYIGVIKVLFVGVAMWLIDSHGRRILMISGIFGMAVSILSLATAFQVALPTYSFHP